MRMEELSDNRYIKTPDTVERYLLNLVRGYFKTNNVASTTSREYIIQKAVERMKDEISFDSIGVLSITLPDGEPRTGTVTISLQDLNGEPIIAPKLTAFNVNFGTEANTACEGNDPRLSDARRPLSHSHDVSDITGLEGMLSTLTGKIDRVNELKHNHKNKSLLDVLVYTGDKSSIDLGKLDTIENKVIELIEQIHDEIITYEQDINSKLQTANQNVINIRNEINNLSQQATETNKDYYAQAKTYVDREIGNLQSLITSEIDNLVTKDSLTNLFDMASNTYSLVGEMSFDLNSVININDTTLSYEVDIPINDTIITELNNRVQNLSQCQIETIMEYIDTENVKQYCYLPYVIINDYSFDGMLQIATCFSTQKIRITLNVSSGMVPDLIKEARIIYKVYSKKAITL